MAVRLPDLRIIKADTALGSLLKRNEFPSTDAAGDWLRRTGLGEGYAGLGRVNRRAIAASPRWSERTEHTLDVDATQIMAEKRLAYFTYKEVGYMPMVGHLAETGIVLLGEFREGNVAPAASNLEFIRCCRQQRPSGHRITQLRADSATYLGRHLQRLRGTGGAFAIGGRLDAATQRAIKAIPGTAWKTYADCAVAETTHSMNETRKTFRMIVVKYPHQAKLFDDKPKYHVIASNRDESAEATLIWYRQREESSENGIKELKIGFGMERMPCGQFHANAAFFRMGVIAHNLFVLSKQAALAPGWQRHQVRTVRWRLFHLAGKVVRHAGSWVLKIAAEALDLFQNVRAKSFDFSQRFAA